MGVVFCSESMFWAFVVIWVGKVVWDVFRVFVYIWCSEVVPI